MKGLTTPLSRWLRGSCFFMQVLGDLHVTSSWIDTLVLKNRGKYLCYFAASPFPLQGKTNAYSRGTKKDFWRCCRRDLRSSQDIPSTHHKLLSLPLHYLPCASRFPLPHFTFAFSLPLFRSSLFACFLCRRSSSWLVLLSLLVLPIMKFFILNKGREKI